MNVMKLATIEVRFGRPRVKNPAASNPSNELILSIAVAFHLSMVSFEQKVCWSVIKSFKAITNTSEIKY